MSKDTFLKSLSFSLWLSWQELNGRRAMFFINVILVAFLIALPVSLDFMGEARKNFVETRVDYIGPSLILVPEGIMSSDLVTSQFKGRTVSSSTFHKIKRDFFRYLRNAEVRLTVRLPAEGRSMPVAGIDFSNVYSYPFAQYSISGNEVLLGSVAAEKMQKDRGGVLHIRSKPFTIAGIIPTVGGIDDVSVFLPLNILQDLAGLEGRINEIRLFPESASSYEQLKLKLHKHAGELNMIDAYRGDTAEKDIDSTLMNYQKALYAVSFVLIALCIMISTYINLDGRKAEVSTVYTLGASQGLILHVLIFRAVWITVLGAVIGHIIGLLATVLQDHHVSLNFIWSTVSFFEVILAASCLGILVTIPFAFHSVYKRDPVAQL